MEIIAQSTTAWHVFGPWTGYMIGIVLAAALLVLNKKL